MEYWIGIDVGCTNIKALAVTERGKVVAEVSAPTKDDVNGRWTAQVREVYRQLIKKLKEEPRSVGVAAPGLASADASSIAYMPGRLRGIEGLVWQELLQVTKPVPVLNDAHAALMGEAWIGAAQRAANVVLLTLGTGVGGAALVDGHFLRGATGRAGHLGHISLNPEGIPDVANTPGSLEDAIGDCTVHRRSEGRFESTRALVSAAQRGDAAAKAVWDRSVKYLAAGIASLINVLDPQFVVIGGGITKAGPALFVPLRRYLGRFEWRPGGHKVRLVRARLGERAGAYGAAWYAAQHITTRAQ